MPSRIAAALICLFLCACLAPPAFAIRPVVPSKKAQKVRAAIARLGTGEQTRVAVRLLNGTRVKGYISSASDETFTVSDPTSGLQQEVRYSEIAQISGQNLTSNQKIAIGTAILLAFLLALAFALRGS